MDVKRWFALLLALVMLLSLAACGSAAEEPSADQATDDPGEDAASEDESPEEEAAGEETAGAASPVLTGAQSVVIEGFDWGPAVTKTIITLDGAVAADSVTAESFDVLETKESFNWAALGDDSLDPTVHITAEAPRTVTAAYTCDADGNLTSENSNQIALEMSYDPNTGTPYCYDLLTQKNTVCDPYELKVSLTDASTLAAEDGTAITELTVDPAVDLHSAAMPQLAEVDLTGTFTASDGTALSYGSYAPADDGEKHPLVIWIHGAGEGGADPSINNLGNKVSALYEEEFQSIMGGAYVLTPQTPEFWLVYNENGDWQDNPGVDSVYLTALMELIQNYVDSNENIDANRVYVGGCSNGGYMTMDLVLNYPDYFAAAFPICEAYLDSGITDEQLNGLKDLPIWFVYAENDTTVDPAIYEAPTIARLQAIDANVHTSVFEDVHDTSGLYLDENGDPYQYMGHWSWLYFFNNECEENGVSLWNWLAEQSR